MVKNNTEHYIFHSSSLTATLQSQRQQAFCDELPLSYVQMSGITETPDGDLSYFPHFLKSFHYLHTQFHFIICYLKYSNFPKLFSLFLRQMYLHL